MHFQCHGNHSGIGDPIAREPLPVIVWDSEDKRRTILKMRWDLPDPKNYKKLKHIHARAETIDTTRTFASLLADGRRGIVLGACRTATGYLASAAR